MNKTNTALILITFFAFLSAACNGQREKAHSDNEPTLLPVIENLIPHFDVDMNQEMVRSPLYLSHDFGTTWESVGHNLPADIQISFMEWYGEDILIATDDAGLFLSQNNRVSWQQIGAKLPGKKINALFVAEDVIFVSVYGHGFFRSDDLGKTWQDFNYDLPKRNIQSILVGEETLVGTDVGIYRFNTASKHWQLISEPVQVLSLETRSNRLIAGTSQGTLYSIDKGKTWTWIHREGAVHYTRLVGDLIAEMCIHGDLFLSSDWGKQWINANYAPRYPGSYVYEVVAVDDYLIMSNNYGIHRSINGGQHWQLIYATEEMAFFDFLVKDNILYGGTRAWDEYRGRE